MIDKWPINYKENPIMKPTKEGINAAGKATRHVPRPMLGIA